MPRAEFITLHEVGGVWSLQARICAKVLAPELQRRSRRLAAVLHRVAAGEDVPGLQSAWRRVGESRASQHGDVRAVRGIAHRLIAE